MLPANLHLRDIYDTTVEFFALRSPSFFGGQQNNSEYPLIPVADPIAKLTRDCGSLREKLELAEHQLQHSGSDIRMRRDLETTRHELSRSQAEVARLQQQCARLETRLKEMQDAVATRDAEIERLRRRSSSVADMSQRMAGLEFDEQRAKDQSTERFETKVDTWSGAQILEAVGDINGEILQFAASAADAFLSESQPKTTRFSQSKYDATSSRFGPHLAHILNKRDHTQDPMFIQIALQGCISACVVRSLSCFAMGYPTKSDTLLGQIYSHVYAAESQPTSSRWRAITHRHLHNLHPTLQEYAINEWVDTTLRWSSDLLVVAGCSSPDMRGSSRESLRARYADQLQRIAKLVFKLSQVIKEGIMSTNFDVILADHDTKFDSVSMYDAFGQYSNSSEGTVLCTLEVGLKCLTRKSSGEDTDAFTIEQRMLLPAKVVLNSVVDVMEQ